MRTKTVLFLRAALMLLLCPWAPGCRAQSADSSRDKNKAITRIVSLSPSITETLFAVGLGERVVGVTRYCDFPEKVRALPKVGGYLDPNLEAIVGLKPDLVLLTPYHGVIQQNLQQLELAFRVVDQRGIARILDSIAQLGRLGEHPERAQALIDRIRSRLDRVKTVVKGQPRPRVLVCVGRTMGSGSIKDLHLVGNDGFYSELLEWAGGTNAYQGPLAYPRASAEGLLQLQPEVIIEMAAGSPGKNDRKVEELIREWESVPLLKAVKEKHLFIFTEAFTVIPGPRFVELVEKLARTIHPELSWEGA